MKELRQIVERWRVGHGSVLVTLARVQGSSYRHPGARLLVCKDGSYEGSISAGCLEADLLRKAAWLTRAGATVERYSTLFEEAADIPFGLGCGGVMDVLLESVDTAECKALLTAIESTLHEREHSIATWLPSQENRLRRAVIRDDGEVVFSSSDLTSQSLLQAKHAWSSAKAAGANDFLLERLISPQRLFIFGAGDDAKPLAGLATLLGWSVTVVDGRSHLVRKDRFPNANIRTTQALQSVIAQIQHRDAAVIMTHSFVQDAECLAALLPRQPRYLGLLGARQRSSLLLTEAAATTGLSLSECCERVCVPIGLDLGGDGAEAIALAIIAEAQATCSGRTTPSRKLSAATIHGYLDCGLVRPQSAPRCELDRA